MTQLEKEFDLWQLRKQLNGRRQLHSILAAWGANSTRMIVPEFFKKDGQ